MGMGLLRGKIIPLTWSNMTDRDIRYPSTHGKVPPHLDIVEEFVVAPDDDEFVGLLQGLRRSLRHHHELLKQRRSRRFESGVGWGLL